jgi:hypothetical protein
MSGIKHALCRVLTSTFLSFLSVTMNVPKCGLPDKVMLVKTR